MAHTATVEMLRSKFWYGLKSEAVKNATRHHFECGLPYDNLLVKARAAEVEYKVSVPEVVSNPIQSVPVVSSPTQSSNMDLKQIQKQVSSLEARLNQISMAKGRSSEDKRRSQPAFTGTCLYCHKVGHKIAKCWKLKKDQEMSQGMSRLPESSNRSLNS